MISDSIEHRRTIKQSNQEKDKEKIFLTPDIIDQIPYYLDHLESNENQSMLRSILVSLDMPEPYGINIYLYQIVFGEKDSTQQELLDDYAQDLLFFSSRLESFPYLIFSNEKCIVQLLNFIGNSMSKKKRNCASHFLCSIFDHNHERKFIEMPIYEEIFELISHNLDMFPILSSILLYPDDLPKDIFPFISPIIINHLELDDIITASRAMIILWELHEAQIDFDLNLIIKCEERFIGSIDEKIALQLMSLMKYAPEPPHQCLDRILEFIDTCNSQLVKDSLYVLNLFGDDWDEDQKDKIADTLLTLFYKMPQNLNFVLTSMTVEILKTIDRLPVGDIFFFSKVIDLVDVWDNISVLVAVNTIITKTMAVDQETAKKMLLLIKSSKSFEQLAQDKNADIANNAQDVLKLAESYLSE